MSGLDGERLKRVYFFYARLAPRYDASRYSTAAQMSADLAAKNIYRLFAGSVVNRKVLDCGCGSGRLVDLFRRDGARVTGLDQSKEMLRVAMRRSPGANFLVGSVFDVPFGDGEFDVVTCSQVLTHLHTYESPIREFQRVVKRGGTILFDIRNIASGKNMLALVRQWIAGGDYQPHYTTVGHIRRICRHLGLRVDQYRGDDFSGESSLWKGFARTVTFKVSRVD